jgi:Uma2 family endonuclease
MTIQTIAVPTRRRFTVAEYYQMAEAGILRPDERTELIDGEVILMPPMGDPHAGNVNRHIEVFVPRFADVVMVRIQSHIKLDDFQQPEPDVALVRRRADFYTTSSPTPEDVVLIVEVADTSLTYDRRTKGPMYARAGIPEYWLHDVNAATLTVFRDPGPDGYRFEQTLRRGDHIAPLAFPDRPIAVTDLLGEG